MLIDLLAEIAGGLVPGPSGDRGRMLLFSALGVVAALMLAWLRVSAGNPVAAPEWAWSLFGLSIVLGIMGVVFGVFALLRSGSQRLVAVVCVAINGAALLMAWVFSRIG